MPDDDFKRHCDRAMDRLVESSDAEYFQKDGEQWIRLTPQGMKRAALQKLIDEGGFNA